MPNLCLKDNLKICFFEETLKLFPIFYIIRYFKIY